jgi:hypothetical protein
VLALGKSLLSPNLGSFLKNPFELYRSLFGAILLPVLTWLCAIELVRRLLVITDRMFDDLIDPLSLFCELLMTTMACSGSLGLIQLSI